MWVLGGKGDQFELKEEQQFAKQHGVTSLEDGSILIFNNDTYKKDSTIIKIKLDEENSTITLSTMNYACQDLGTSNSNDNIVNGKIKGTVPQYIYLEEKNKVYTVTSMLNTFRNCTNLEYAPEIPTTIRDLIYTFYGCTKLKEKIKINSSIINNVYDCFANVLNNIKLQVPENSTTYNIFNETYGNSPNITIETFARELEWWWPTEIEKKKL